MSMASVLVAGPVEKNSPYQFAGNNDELIKSLVLDPNKIVIVPKKWPWLSDVDLAERGFQPFFELEEELSAFRQSNNDATVFMQANAK